MLLCSGNWSYSDNSWRAYSSNNNWQTSLGRAGQSTRIHAHMHAHTPTHTHTHTTTGQQVLAQQVNQHTHACTHTQQLANKSWHSRSINTRTRTHAHTTTGKQVLAEQSTNARSHARMHAHTTTGKQVLTEQVSQRTLARTHTHNNWQSRSVNTHTLAQQLANKSCRSGQSTRIHVHAHTHAHAQGYRVKSRCSVYIFSSLL